jgi:hypothetical protein
MFIIESLTQLWEGHSERKPGEILFLLGYLHSGKGKHYLLTDLKGYGWSDLASREKIGSLSEGSVPVIHYSHTPIYEMTLGHFRLCK